MVNLIDKYLGESEKEVNWKEFYDMARDTSGKTFKKFSGKYSGPKFQMPHIEDALKNTKDFKSFMKIIKKFEVSEENILATIGSMGRMPGTWGKRLGSFGTVLYRALDREGIAVISLEPIGKFDNELIVNWKGKEKKIKLTGDMSADKVIKKIKGNKKI